MKTFAIHQASVVQRLDRAIHRINCYPAVNCLQNIPRYFKRFIGTKLLEFLLAKGSHLLEITSSDKKTLT